MPRYFLTEVWGFSPDDYPVLGFTPNGGLRKFLRESNPDDWVVVAGTRGAETAEAERGRLLGMMKLGRNTVDVVAVLRSLDTPIPREHFRADGSYKWPTGLPMVEARRFVDTPDLATVFGNYLPGKDWAAFAHDLSKKFPAPVVAAVTGFAWEIAMEPQRFRTEVEAHRFEQAVHARLRPFLAQGETEVYQVRPGDIETEWLGVLSTGRWALDG